MRAEHIAKTVEKDSAAAGWWFSVDQLNTHKSESLVRLVAEKEGIAESKLGEKGKSGMPAEYEKPPRILRRGKTSGEVYFYAEALARGSIKSRCGFQFCRKS